MARPVGSERNTSTVSGTNAPQSVTITPNAEQRVYLDHLSAFTSAGSATLSIESPAGTVRWQGPAAGITAAPAIFQLQSDGIPGFAKGVAVVITVGTAGVGNTSTLNIGAFLAD